MSAYCPQCDRSPCICEEQGQEERNAQSSLAPAPGSGFRLHIEADGLRQSDAAAHALRLIGMMMQNAHTKGHSCGGETGNASGRWELIPNNKLTGGADGR